MDEVGILDIIESMVRDIGFKTIQSKNQVSVWLNELQIGKVVYHKEGFVILGRHTIKNDEVLYFEPLGLGTTDRKKDPLNLRDPDMIDKLKAIIMGHVKTLKERYEWLSRKIHDEHSKADIYRWLAETEEWLTEHGYEA